MYKRLTVITLLMVGSSISSAADIPVSTLVSSQPSTGSAGITLTIRNISSQPLTGWLARTRVYEGSKLRMDLYNYMDVYVNAEHDHPLAPGELVSSRVPGVYDNTKYKYESELIGALFADGTAAGTSDGIRILDGRRRALQQGLAKSITTLSTTTGNALGREAAIRELSAGIRPATEADKLNHTERYIAMVNVQLSDFLTRSLGRVEDVCDDACSAARFDGALHALTRWHASLSKGMSERRIPTDQSAH